MVNTTPTPQWVHYALPAACAATTIVLYTNKGRIVKWVYDYIAKSAFKSPPGKPYLSGNYAPVDKEVHEQELVVVEGKLPAGLEGAFVRNGPNPLLKPVAGYHWFDGDGMLHTVRLKGGVASYSNRWVETSRLKQERKAGRPMFPKLGDMCSKAAIAMGLLWKLLIKMGAVDLRDGGGTANTALAYHAGRLLALNEGDLPYAIRVLCNGLTETLGRLRFSRSWKTNFTAHPKIDPVNGDMLFISYRYEANPYVSAGVLDEFGNLVRHWGVEVPYPTMMHDMAATENYIVLMHLPVCFDGAAMVKHNSVPLVLKRELPSRFGLLRRDSASSPNGGSTVLWFELKGEHGGFYAVHTANSFEEKGLVKVYACQQDFISFNLDSMDGSKELGRLTEYTFDPKTGAATARRLTEVTADFPVVNPYRATRPNKWVWMAVMDPAASTAAFTGIAKADITAKPGKDAVVAKITYPPGVYGGEAVFVPKVTANGSDRTAAVRHAESHEDDGYLVVYVHNTNEDVSYLHIYDAHTMAPKPVAAVRMPQRVPYGFHGTWVTEQQIKSQVAWV